MMWENSTHKITTLTIALIGVGLVSCGTLSRSARAVSGKVKTLNNEPGKLKPNQYDLNDNEEQGLSALTGNAIVSKSGQLSTREEDIVWAPEDPNMPITELEGLSLEDAPADSWYIDFDKAMNKAEVEGKPIMIWFTRSKNSPLCKQLSSELLVHKEFEDWADANVVRLRVDSNIVESDTGKRKDREQYVEDLKKRFQVLGQPVVVIISPRGTEFGKYRGYKSGTAEFYFGRLRNAQRSAQEDYAGWKSEMESKGYRTWYDARGRSVFAKVLRYRDGTIWLVEPDGKKSSTKVSKLAAEDRQYIDRKIAESRAKKPIKDQ
jgi:hypothetical protein